MKVLRITALVMLALLFVACGKQQSSQTSANGNQQKVSQQAVDPKIERGKAVYDETGCATCHAIGGIGGMTGPSLDKIGRKYEVAKLKEILVNPKTLNPNTVMPPFEGSEEDLEALVTYLLSMK